MTKRQRYDHGEEEEEEEEVWCVYREEVGNVVLGDADAGVAHGQLNNARVAPTCQVDRDGALLRCELDGIREEAVHDLPEPVPREATAREK